MSFVVFQEVVQVFGFHSFGVVRVHEQSFNGEVQESFGVGSGVLSSEFFEVLGDSVVVEFGFRDQESGHEGSPSDLEGFIFGFGLFVVVSVLVGDKSVGDDFDLIVVVEDALGVDFVEVEVFFVGEVRGFGQIVDDFPH